jgi:excisionase family DNA binding protein
MSLMTLDSLPPILSRKETAELLRLTERSIDKLRVAGRLPSFRVAGNSVRFKRDDVLGLLHARPDEPVLGPPAPADKSGRRGVR